MPSHPMIDATLIDQHSNRFKVIHVCRRNGSTFLVARCDHEFVDVDESLVTRGDGFSFYFVR